LAAVWVAPVLAQTNVLTVDSSGNVKAGAGLSAASGVQGGTYTSGLTASGSSGQTCYLAFTNGGGAGGVASVALPLTGTPALTIVVPGYGYTSAPTTAAVTSGGTAPTCTGTSVVVTTYLNGQITLLASPKPGTPPISGSGTIWFDSATAGDWPLPVPMALDSSGNYISAMVRMSEGSSTGPYYWGVGGVLPAATWTVSDTNSGNTSVLISGSNSANETIEAGTGQSGNIWAVENSGGSPFWSVPAAGTLTGSAGNSVVLTGSSSGTVSVAPPASPGTYNFILPASAGSSGQVLASGGGSSPMTWTSNSMTVNGQTCTLGSPCTVSGATNTQTGTYSMTASDLGKLVIMNCSSTCAVTLYATPSNGFYGAIESVGTATATVSLGGLNFNGSATAPVLNRFVPLLFWSNGTNYFGQPPLTAGSGITLTPSTSALTMALAAPTTSVLGGLFALSGATASNWVTYIDSTGTQHLSQPAFSDISGTGNVVLNNQVNTYSYQTEPSAPTSGVSVWTDTTGQNLEAISSGGGTLSVTVRPASAMSHEWINAIGQNGSAAQSQPAFSDVSGTATAPQLPNTTAATWFGSNGGGSTFTGTSYLGAGEGSTAASVGGRQWISPVNCTLRYFYVATLNNNGSGILNFTIYDSTTVGSVGTATALAVPQFNSGAAAAVHSDLTDTALVSAGDALTVVATMSSGTSAPIGPWGVMCEPN